MRRLALVAIGVAAAASAAVAVAATLGLTTDSVAIGEAAIVRCDTDGFTISYAVATGSVTSVTVAGISDPACEGATVRVTLTDTAGAELGSGTKQVATDGDTSANSETVAVTPNPGESAVSGIRVAVEGP